jgi:hypothetical protein
MLQALVEEAEEFMTKMWRFIMFITEASRLSLLD